MAQMTTAALNTLKTSALSAVTVGQIRQIVDLLNRLPYQDDSKTIANVLTALGTANP